MMAAKTQESRPAHIIATNRSARRNYHVIEKFEAGIALLGTEVKSARSGKVDLAAGFASIENGQAVLRDVHIKPYEFGHQFNHEPRRPRRLLLHRRELDKLLGKVTAKGLTLIPLSLYFNQRGMVKVEIGLCRGKLMRDKRETLRQKAADQEAERAMAASRDRAR